MLLKGCGFILKFSKEHNFVNSVGGVMVLVLLTLSDNGLYLYQILSKYRIGFQGYGPEACLGQARHTYKKKENAPKLFSLM